MSDDSKSVIVSDKICCWWRYLFHSLSWLKLWNRRCAWDVVFGTHMLRTSLISFLFRTFWVILSQVWLRFCLWLPLSDIAISETVAEHCQSNCDLALCCSLYEWAVGYVRCMHTSVLLSNMLLVYILSVTAVLCRC